MVIKIKRMAGKPSENPGNGITPKPKGSLSLPTKENEPPESIFDYSICLFGEKGAGKSSIMAKFPDTTFFYYDPVRRNLRIKQIPKAGEPVPKWPEFKQYCQLMIKAGIRPVFDPIDLVWNAGIKFHCAQLGVKDLGELTDFGKGWRLAIDDIQGTLNSFREAGIVPLYTSHVRSRPLLIKGVQVLDKDAKGEEPMVVQPTATGACWEFLRLATDLAMYLGYRGLERVLHVRGSEYVWAGGGVEDHFLQPVGFIGEGEPLNMLPMGKSPQEAYDNLLKAWDNELPGYFYDQPSGPKPKGRK